MNPKDQVKAAGGNRKKKNFFIYPKFQLVLIAANSGILLLVIGIISFQVNSLMNRFQELGKTAGFPDSHGYFTFIEFQKNSLNQTLLVAAGIAIGFGLIANIMLSHRVAGPLVRLRGYFSNIAAGGNAQASPLSFRKGDFFQEITPQINQAIQKLQAKN